jgi:hypothetical protein
MSMTKKQQYECKSVSPTISLAPLEKISKTFFIKKLIYKKKFFFKKKKKKKKKKK